MKRTLSLVLALVMVLGTFTGVFAAADETALDLAAEVLEREGVLKGDGDDLMLDNDLLRRDMVVLVSRLMKAEALAEEFDASELTFEDITDNHYNGYLAWSVENNIIEGHDEKTFGFNESVTVQDFAVVLLRVLGYEVTGHEPWKAAFANAKKLGLLDNVDVEEKDEVVRGVMAVMTFNALGTAMYDTDETLAEFLDIEMPEEEKAQDLELEAVYTENLKEIIIEVNNGDLLDEEDVTKVDNYRISGKKVSKVTVEGDLITLLLKEGYNANQVTKNDEVVIRNMNRANRALNGIYKFEIRDNEAPVILGAEYLGKHGIKVTVSEPINNPIARNFRLLEDGKDRNIVMDVKAYDREIILTPYGNEEFDLDRHDELKVTFVTDFAGIRSTETVVEIEEPAEGYDAAPEVVDVKAYGNELQVTFDREIYSKSVKAWEKSTATGNVDYLVRGKLSSYASGKDMIDPYTAVYEFDRTLSDRFTEVVISGVENHEGIEMAKVTRNIEVILDRSEPVVIRTDVIDLGLGDAKVVLEFDKNIKGMLVEDENGNEVIDVKNHFKLFESTLGKYQTNVSEKVVSATIAGNDDNMLTIVLEDLDAENKDGDAISYILETSRFEDTSVLGNIMFTEYTIVERSSATTALGVVSITPSYMNTSANRIEELEVVFDKDLDRASVEDERNYVFTDQNGRIQFLDDLGGYVELDNNGKTVNIVFPNGLLEERYNQLEMLKGIRGYKGEVLPSSVIYNFANKSISGAIQFTNSSLTHLAITNEYRVTPNAASANVTITTALDTTIYVNGDAAKVTVNAPNAHLVVNAGVEVNVLEVKNISKNSIEILGTVNKLVVDTTTKFKVTGNVDGMVIEAARDKVEIIVVGEKVVDGETVFIENTLKLDEGEVAVVAVAADGTVTTPMPNAELEKQESVMNNVYKTVTAENAEFTAEEIEEFKAAYKAAQKALDAYEANADKAVVADLKEAIDKVKAVVDALEPKVDETDGE